MPASTPSISTDMNFAAEMPRAADWLVDHLRGIVPDVGSCKRGWSRGLLIRVWRIRRGDRTGMNRALMLTLFLGIVFLALQVYDYFELVTHEGFGINSGIYGSLFYTMTGFHGAHVFGGVVGIFVILLRGLAGQFSAKHHIAVEAVSAYWHFVDIVWIGLFFVLYFLK